MRVQRLLLLPAVLSCSLHAQPQPHSENFVLTAPGIVTRIERFAALSPVGTLIAGFAVDSTGFLWCRTDKGIARFDGYELKTYPVDFADSDGTFRTELQAIAVDGEGFVWGATPNGGLQRLDPRTGRSRWYRGRPDDPASIGTGATRLVVTSDGQLWAGARYGLARYDPETDTFIRYNLPPDCPPVRAGVVPAGYIITSICELGRSLWIGLIGGGLAQFDRDSGSWKRFTGRDSTGAGPSHDVVRAVYADHAGRLWIGTRDFGLDRHDPRTGEWDHYSVTKDGVRRTSNDTTRTRSVPVWSLAEDDFGGIWISAISAGVFRFDPANDSFVHFRHDSADENAIPSNLLLWLGVMRPAPRQEPLSAGHVGPGTSTVWIPHGSYAAAAVIEGTHRAIVRRDPCSSVVLPGVERSVAPAVSAVLRNSSGRVWAGLFNYRRIGSFDLRTQRVRWYPTPGSADAISQLCVLRDGTLLASTRLLFEGAIFDGQQERFVPFLPDLPVCRFLEGTDSLLWVGCRSPAGMSYLAAHDRRTGRTIVYPRQDRDSARYLDAAVLTMCDDGQGALWYGTAGGGLLRFDLEHKSYRRFAANPESDDALIANGVGAVIPDSNGTLWVGTNVGMALMDRGRGTFEHLRSRLLETGEPQIRDMVADGEGHLWIAAHEGALCFTKATRTFRLLASPPQFQKPSLRAVSFDPATRIVTFGGAGGFFMFPVDDPPAASPPPRVVFTSFKVFEKAYPLEADVWSLESIRLPSSDSFFSFTFATLDYIDPARNQYAYQMEGLDPDWIYAGSRRYVSYNNLDPGTYVFRVRGANSEGVWNEQGASIEIVVLPPWYRTVWAYGAYLLGFVGLLFLLRGFDRKREALKHRLEMKSFEAEKIREVDHLKSAFFANISHEFRTPLTLILGPLDQLTRRFQHDEQLHATLSMMRRNGLRLLHLINQILDLSRIDAGKMRLQVSRFDPVSLSRSLTMSFLSLAERKRIRLLFEPGSGEITGYTDREQFETIFTNLLSNAFKFTGEGGEIRVVVRVVGGNEDRGQPETSGERVEIAVSDTGIGIDPEHLTKVFDRFYQVSPSHATGNGGTGIGLSLVKDLVGVLKGTIAAESSPGHGSTFTFQLPLDRGLWGPEEIAPETRSPEPEIMESPTDVLDEEEAPCAKEGVRERGKPVVLIVEDNDDVRSYVRGFLEDLYTVEEAENGKTGQEKTLNTDVDLVVTDIMMPVMDGVQLCRALKADTRTDHIPVVLLTARATQEGKLEGLESGADDYVVKPFDAHELLARVKNLIDLRRNLREKFHRQIILEPRNIPVTSADERFLNRLTELVEGHIPEADYDTSALAHDMCMSRMQLNRKLHALTGRSTHELVRQYRLQRAALLLRKDGGTVAEVAFASGFNSLSHFARAFREQFGVPPSEYRERGPRGSAQEG